MTISLSFDEYLSLKEILEGRVISLSKETSGFLFEQRTAASAILLKLESARVKLLSQRRPERGA